MLGIELDVALRNVTDAMIKKPLNGVVAQRIAVSADDRSKCPPQIVRRENDPTSFRDLADLSARIGDSLAG